MTATPWVSVAALVGWLVLAFGAFRARRVGARKSLVMAIAWLAIFLPAAAIFSYARN